MTALRDRLTELKAGLARIGILYRWRLSVGWRVAILCILPIIGFAALAAISGLSVLEIRGSLDRSRVNIRQAMDMKAFRDRIVEMQVAVDDFTIEPTAATRAKVLGLRDGAAKAIAAMTGTEKANLSPGTTATLTKGLKTVSQDVDDVLHGQEALGFDHHSGVTGEVTKDVDALEALVRQASSSDPAGGVAMLEHLLALRHGQLDFAATHDDGQAEGFRSALADLQRDAGQPGLADRKSEIDAAAGAAKKAFERWVKAAGDLSISQRAASGHFRMLSAAAANAVVSASRSADTAQGKLSDSQDRATLMIAATIGAAIILCSGFGFVIGRSISQPIVRLAHAMREMAAGNLDVTVDARRGDEIAQMADAVLTFRKAALEQRRLEAAAADARATADAERARREREKEVEAGENRLVVDSIGSGLAALSDGNLSLRLHEGFPQKSEQLRLDFNGAVETLSRTMVAIADRARMSRSRTDAIAAATDDLSRRTESQASNLEATANSLDAITETVKSSADHATTAREAVAVAKANAQNSERVVQRSIDAMGGIESSSKQIGQIIAVIDEIAFQTNLLALNAGVEAARAGEAGRGFAVVASEVRALAQRSAQSAKEIKTLVSAATGHVDQGVGLVAQAGSELAKVVSEISHIDDSIAAIAASATQQAGSLAQVNDAVRSTDRITQQNAAMVEETTAAVTALVEDIEQLDMLIGQFKTEIPLSSPASTPGRTRRPLRTQAA
ncbi:HAMP domain-containing methyl-accepting chemotaxis protein [Lichenihabitans sp. Uapishka_5]|uniref:methyl-accepting chemotaxis protein n=1 Tax=Lichenihabitans sp. Uapishka_5 TaxID=3037302 RepID=UPI0029E805DF|nr:HAMP domain-containing methyl-accepting chemotaxis protein [Lichenihabitans sp. Uapishka_5]MDX7952344.1 HAMP domain-containing methyl-accepting chemotaxis protein [Lichenihabitans sp. Uapishka_5]